MDLISQIKNSPQKMWKTDEGVIYQFDLENAPDLIMDIYYEVVAKYLDDFHPRTGHFYDYVNHVNCYLIETEDKTFVSFKIIESVQIQKGSNTITLPINPVYCYELMVEENDNKKIYSLEEYEPEYDTDLEDEELENEEQEEINEDN
ncbi:MAG: hypothetical protein UIM53_02755 [Acutalibacteraceae bacterium]|nr:hypothetical protein [Acutalibacteraceae bacterium]